MVKINNLDDRYKRLDWEYRMEYSALSKPYLDKLNSINNRFYLFQYFTFLLLGFALLCLYNVAFNNNISFAAGVSGAITSASNHLPLKIIIAFIVVTGPIADAIRYIRINNQLIKIRHNFLLRKGA